MVFLISIEETNKYLAKLPCLIELSSLKLVQMFQCRAVIESLTSKHLRDHSHNNETGCQQQHNMYIIRVVYDYMPDQLNQLNPYHIFLALLNSHNDECRKLLMKGLSYFPGVIKDNADTPS